MAVARRQARQRAMLAPMTRATISALRRRPGAVACVFAAAVTALAAAGCGSGGTAGSSSSDTRGSLVSSGAAPACLPATLDHSAKLAGVPVDV